MKIFAGDVFHHRKPTRAALRIAASRARSRGSRTE
jgi:DNA repair exonuclease SbcCD nuclease subunit